MVRCVSGQLVSWVGGLANGWSIGLVIKCIDGLVIGWSVVRWADGRPGGQMVRCANGRQEGGGQASG